MLKARDAAGRSKKSTRRRHRTGSFFASLNACNFHKSWSRDHFFSRGRSTKNSISFVMVYINFVQNIWDTVAINYYIVLYVLSSLKKIVNKCKHKKTQPRLNLCYSRLSDLRCDKLILIVCRRLSMWYSYKVGGRA